ncbi:MAG: response regulator [Lachnospiraceae bacterium]|nr:response regulator [Lachnospiraceae bacterium]
MQTAVKIIQWINVFIIITELGIVLRNMRTRLHALLLMHCGSMLVSSIGYLMMLYCHTEEAFFMAHLLSWGGKIFTLIAGLQICSCICGYRLPKWLEIAGSLIVGLTCIIIVTTKQTGLFYSRYQLEPEADRLLLLSQGGPWYYFWDIIVVTVIAACLIMLYKSFVKERDPGKKKQILMLLSALLIETVICLFAVLPVSRYYDFNQIGFSLSTVILLIAIFRFNLVDVETAAKDVIIDELSTGVIVLNTRGEAVYQNKAALRIFPELKNDIRGVTEQITNSIQTDKPVTVGDRLYTFEEKSMEGELQGGGRIYIIMDVTGHYRHLKELEEQKKIADNANKAKSIFLARMSHEIRTPINTVLGMDEMILRESGDSTIREYATDIRVAGKILLSLINDILDLSKIEAGKMEILPAPYDLSSLIHDVSNMIRFRAEDKNLVFRIHVSPDIPAGLIGDDVRVRQVLMNLLTNAVKYTEKGSVELRVSMKELYKDEKGQRDNVLLRFEVEDTGIGIKYDDMVKLFASFQRIDGGQLKKIEGTGLGIPITMKLLDLMGAELELTSEYGKGSKFYFDLWQGISDMSPVGDFEKNIENLTSEQYFYTESFTAPDAHILLVDDNSMNRKVFTSLLKQTEIKIEEAGSGKEALGLSAGRHFDIIFMDHMMPDMDGIETLKRIKALKDGPCADTPIVVLTANAVAGAKESYLAEGFDGYLSKPVSSDKLEETLREMLPAEKVKGAPGGTAGPEKRSEAVVTSAEIKDLPVIFGLDWKVALMRLQSREILDSSLCEFEAVLEEQADELQRFKNSMPETLNDYRIMVHGMKSVANSIGIITLAGMAAVLEKAAADGDEATIDRLHDVFIREWRSYKDRLKEYPGIAAGYSEEKEEIKPEILGVLLNMLSAAMKEMDIDGADDAIKKLSSFRLPGVAAGEFDALKAAVAQLDQDRVLQIISDINDKLAQGESPL